MQNSAAQAHKIAITLVRASAWLTLQQICALVGSSALKAEFCLHKLLRLLTVYEAKVQRKKGDLSDLSDSVHTQPL